MPRKLSLVLVLTLLSLLATGCRKKAPVTPEPLAPATTTTQRSAAPAPEPAAPAPEPDPWSGDIDAVNRYARDHGLLGDVYFDYDRFELRTDARDQLATNARFFKEHPQFVITIEGHCDERGTNEYNLALGEGRASSAGGYLQNLGVPGGRLQTISYGKERPVCGESQEDCWWRNRRAHFVITGRAG
jgi:peptidoglycan-associated lipoprotein